MEKERVYSSPYEFEGKIPLKQAIPLGLQHVLAMFVGNLTPILIISGACGGELDVVKVSLLQNAMLVAGIVTLVQLFAIGPCGGKVPIIMGTVPVVLQNTLKPPARSPASIRRVTVDFPRIPFT